MLKNFLRVKSGHCLFAMVAILFVTGCKTVNAPEFGGTVRDIDGNEYHTITIGTQTWMIENLKTTRLNDSTDISMTSDSAAWTNLTMPGYCWYDNDSVSNKNEYGALYNWYAVNSRKLAPKGWHVPTEEEWKVLEDNVNEYLYTAGSLSKTLAAASNWAKSAKSGAIGNNIALNNSSGFTALPGGLRDNNGHSFNSIGFTGSWWSSIVKSDTTSLSVLLNYDLNTVERYNRKKWSGLSVRCIKDSN